MTDPETRWPHAKVERRIPMRAYAGSSPEATAALRDLLYLDEMERQARIFTRSFGAAMDAALVADDREETWRQLQGAMFAAIVVNRLVDAKGMQRGWPGVSDAAASRIANERAKRLRALVGLPDPSSGATPIFAVRNVRDSMEHIDQRLDWVCQDADRMGGISDWYLSDGVVAVMRQEDFPDAPPLGLRAFIPTSGTLLFNDSVVSMFWLDIDMLGLQHNINDARIELAALLASGRLTFGGSQVVEYSDDASRLKALADWESERKNRMANLMSTGIDGVTLWIQRADSTVAGDEDRGVTGEGGGRAATP